jgi:hypothetical protein
MNPKQLPPGYFLVLALHCRLFFCAHAYYCDPYWGDHGFSKSFVFFMTGLPPQAVDWRED